MFVNIRREALSVDMLQVAWALLSTISGLWLISCLGPVVYAVSSWAHTTMPVVAKILFASLLWVGSCPAQLFFHTAQERVTAQNPHATNGDLGREGGMPEPTKAM